MFRIGRGHARHVYPEPQSLSGGLALSNHQQGPLVGKAGDLTKYTAAPQLIGGVVLLPQVSGNFIVAVDAAVTAGSFIPPVGVVGAEDPAPGKKSKKLKAGAAGADAPGGQFQLFAVQGALLVNGIAPTPGFYRDALFTGPGTVLTSVTGTTTKVIEDTMYPIPLFSGNSIVFGLTGLVEGFLPANGPVFFGLQIVTLTTGPGGIIFPGEFVPPGKPLLPCGQIYAQEIL